VGAGVVQVFALEEDLRAAGLFRPALGVVDGRRAADEVGQLVAELFEEFGIVAVARVGFVQLGQRVGQRLGDEAAAVGAEVALGIGELIIGGLEQIDRSSALPGSPGLLPVLLSWCDSLSMVASAARTAR
jgi:hypothetical protein